MIEFSGSFFKTTNPMTHSVIKIFYLNFSVGILFFCSCTSQDPEGKYVGEVKDWVHEVFEGNLVAGGKECRVELSLSQGPETMQARLFFEHPEMRPVQRSGVWEIGDGERVVQFDDDKKPSEYYLIKRGVRHAFQSKEGLTNDDGSPLLLVRNVGKSRKASYPIEIIFGPRGGAVVEGAGISEARSGEWSRVGDRVTVTIKLPTVRMEKGEDMPEENYKYFMSWSSEKEEALVLEKMVVMRPFVREDGSKRQSWMSSLIFSDRPELVAK
jgi:hypothetical protein